MEERMKFSSIAICLFFLTSLISAQDPGPTPSTPKGCEKFTTIDDKGSKPLMTVSLPPHGVCHAKATANGEQLPDPACTPGAINPTLTAAVLKDPAFRTGCVRNDATSEKQKGDTYKWYKTKHPKHNQGATQYCELDHLIPLYLGGADTLENIWPECGPARVHVDDRYFKEKDKVELYLGLQVREGKMDLADAQNGIAKDWTKFISDAENYCSSGKCEFKGQ
jgi:hypothetical protein